MFPYAEESFSQAESELLKRYFTNLDGPVFALVNLPEVTKGALFARYSRSAKSLRRLFLDEFVGDLDTSGDAGTDATVASTAPSASTSACSSTTATIRWHSWAGSTSRASRPPTCSPRFSSGDG